MKNQTKILIPSYAEDFKCIGGECEDSCCIGWDIDIDKNTFRKYSRTKDVQMKQKFEEHIYRNKECYNKDVDYGLMAINNSKWCPFLDKDKYCEIQRNLGEDYLSNVCYSFPRVYNILNGIYELSLHMSCPEAVRKLLSSKDPIKFAECDMPGIKHIVYSFVDTRDKGWKKSPMGRLPELRSLSIDIIQNRSRSINERLMDLGSMLENITQNSSPHKETITESIGNRNRYTFQLEFFTYVIESLGVIDETDSPAFARYSNLVKEEFGLSENNFPETKVDLYQEAIKAVVKPFAEENSYIFEHYLVNSIYQDNFPFSENYHIFDAYVILVVRYALIQFYLTGIAAGNRKLTIEDIVVMIQVHTKIINHHKTFLLNLLMEIKRKQFDSMEIISLILI